MFRAMTAFVLTLVAPPPQTAPPALLPQISRPPSFSPDGRFVALLHYTSTGRGAGPWQLCIVDTVKWQSVTMPERPAWRDFCRGRWSEDGRYFVVPLGADQRRRASVTRNVEWAYDPVRREWEEVSSPKYAPIIGGNGDWTYPVYPAVIARWYAPKRCWNFKQVQHSPRFKHITQNKIMSVRRYAVSADGKYWACVVGGTSTECVVVPSELVLICADQAEVRSLGAARALCPVAWSKNGDRLLYSGVEGAAVYDVALGRSVELARDRRTRLPIFHPVTDAVWAVRGNELVEYVDGEWMTRFTIEP